MKSTIALFAMATTAYAAGLVTGQPLPELKGEFLTGKPAVLPQAAAGRVSLLLLGFSYDSRFQVEAWSKAFRKEFGTNPKANFYEVPMIGGMARMGKWFIDSGMRKGTPKADHENVITVYGGTDPWKQRVDFTDPKGAYLILLDPSGVVAWTYSGSFTEAAYQTVSGETRKLLEKAK